MTGEALQVNRFKRRVNKLLQLFCTFLIIGCGHNPIGHSQIYSGPLWSDSAPTRIIVTRCVWVGDGDTLKTIDGEDVRLLGINAPEIAHPGQGKLTGEPFGEAARDRLIALVQGETVTLVIPVGRERDAYGRLLALVFLGDSPVRGRATVNELLVQSGLAHVFIMENSGFLNTEAWVALQGGAQKERLGIWSLPADRLPELETDTRNEAVGAIEGWMETR